MIYCDLDGVLADFTGRTKELFGKTPEEYREQGMGAELWRDIRDYGYTFWSEMEALPGALDLWKLVDDFHGRVLTSVPFTGKELAMAGKEIWMERRYITKRDMVVGAHEKAMFAGGINDILIDDYGKTCEQWIESGGTAIHHRSVDETIDILLAMLVK